jgi:hypothetical protein
MDVVEQDVAHGSRKLLETNQAFYTRDVSGEEVQLVSRENVHANGQRNSILFQRDLVNKKDVFVQKLFVMLESV